MKTNNTQWLDPVLDLVQKHDPDTYLEMLNTDWTVNIIAEDRDLFPIAQQIEQYELADLVHHINSALGCTIGLTTESKATEYYGPPALNHTTWMSHWNLMRDAARAGHDPLKLAATVFVHEWTHRQGYGEREAYAAGARFARKMGEEKLAQAQERTGTRVEAHKRAEARTPVFWF